MRTDGYAPIEDYALIGDGRTCALVARDGSIDWLPVPSIDSPPVFARIVDAANGGAFELQPAEPFEAIQRYEEGSNVLATTFSTAAGKARVVDALVLTDTAPLAPIRELVRRVEGLSGSVELRWRVTPRFEFGRAEGRIAFRSGRFAASSGPTALTLAAWDAGEPKVTNGAIGATFTTAAGSTALIDLAVAHAEPAVMPGRDDAEERLERTRRFWPRWSGRAEYEGPWREAVIRSALVLKLLCFAPSGAIVAAPTSSLPEWIGGRRNWDYRYSWVRDASWTLDALLRLGYHDEAHAYFWWLMHASRLTLPRLQVFYRVDGSVRTPELELAGLDGYRGSKPVRVGNGAADQVQLDVYGDVFGAIWSYSERTGRVDRSTGRDVAKIADYVARHWRDHDAGIWEVRSDGADFVQSKVMCWVALDRACALAERGVIPDRSETWRSEADAIRSFVDQRGWDARRRTYVRASGDSALDASLLTIALSGYEDPAGERVAGTIEAVRQELGAGELLYRYRADDGVGGDEGAFLACSFWLVDALARAGRVGEASTLMDELVGRSNDVLLLPEEIDPESGEFLGNFPQALSHLALINAAVSIEDARGGG